MKKELYSAKPAFTLLELLIVMGILVIVFAISFTSLNTAQRSQIFSNNVTKLFSLISNARSQAISGKGQLDFTDYDHDGFTYSTSPLDYVTPANYGVHFQTDSAPQIVLFADINPPGSASFGAKGRYDAGVSYSQGHDVVLDSLSLPEDNVLKIIDGGGATPVASSIFYSPNYADINYENLDTTTSPFTKIQLTNTETTACRQFTIHKLAGIPEVGPCT